MNYSFDFSNVGIFVYVDIILGEKFSCNGYAYVRTF